MLMSIGLTLVVTLAIVQFSRGQSTERNAAGEGEPAIEFEKYTLPNGMDVILHVDRKLPVVHVNQWYHVGSKNERPGRTGFAHLFEHVMFQGSQNAADDYFRFVERAGANLREGGVNGTTSTDRTNYFATVPSGNLEYLLWLESDRLATLDEALTQEKLDEQREVVRNERRQGLENQPYGRWYMLLSENLFPADHPYSWPVIGSHEDLQAATLDDVKEFFRRYYTPNNLTLVIAGDFDPAEAKRLVEKYFGAIAGGPALERPARYIPRLSGTKIVEVNDRVPQQRTYFVWPSPRYFESEEPALEMAAAILTDGLSSRLSKALVYDRQIASDVNSFNYAQEIAGFFGIIATARPDASLPEVEKVVLEEVKRLAEEGPTQAELDRAKTKWEYQFISGLERIGGFGGKADLLAQYNTFLGDPGKFDEDLRRYRSVTAADVKQATARWLNTEDRLLIRFHPEPSGRITERTLDRSNPPALGTDPAFRTPEVKSAKLSNGMDLMVVERTDLPKVSITFATRAGSVADPDGKSGTANLTTRTIDMGTRTRNALQLADAFGDLGTTLSGNTSRELSFLNLEVLSRNLVPALDLMADVVIDAQFPEEEVQREVKRQLDALGQQSNDPNALSARIRPMLSFGSNHPYGRPSQGLPSTVQKVTRADITAFHRTYWKPGSSALVMVGDISLANAQSIAEKAFGQWGGGGAPAVEIPPAQPMGIGQVFIVDRQNAAQTVVSQLLPAPRRQAEDYYPFRLLDAVWGGGGFGTRLNLNLREEKGYSYGVFSNVALFSNASSWWATGGVQTDKTKESIAEFVKELENLAGAKPISEEELVFARETRVRGYAQRFESLGRIGQQIAELWALELPLTELQREVDATASAGLQDVLTASKQYVKPDMATLLLVGDYDEIEPGLRSLNLGEIVVLDQEGKPVN
jgi:zinc protease